MSYTISFAALVKNNNGMFKSPAQAALLLSVTEDNDYVAVDSVYGNSFTTTYTCDVAGVTRVTRYARESGNKVIWERAVQGVVTVQDAKEIKRIKREIKKLEKSIAERDQLYAAGQYQAHMDLYTASNASDEQQLFGYEAKLAAFSTGK